MMKNTEFQSSQIQGISSKSLKEITLLENENLKASLASLESSGSKRADFRSSIDLETEPEGHNSSSVWKINSGSDPNIKVTQAYFGGDPVYNGYFEEFTTHDPIDFDIELKESEDNYENNSSSSSSLSKSSKKISKLQKEELAQHNAPIKYERAKGKKNPWQASEDAKVLELVAHYGQSWALIAAALGNRTGKQVRDRYLNYLRADIKDEDFTMQEDRLLLSLYYQWGHKWSKIASQLPGRTECQVKNRFYAHIKKRLAFPDILNSQRNAEDMFFENNHAKENRFMFEENKEGVFQADPTDVISYENKNRTITQISQNILSNQYSYSSQSTQINENIQSTKKLEGEEVSIDFLSSFNNANAFCDDALLKTEVKSDMKVESDPELIHHQAMAALQNDLKMRERAQRYEDLMRRKKALEYFYSKTLQEMKELGINDFSTPQVPK